MNAFLNLFSDPLFDVLTVMMIAAVSFNFWEISKRKKVWKRITEETSLVFAEKRSGFENYQTLSGLYHHHQLTLKEGNFPFFRKGKKVINVITNASTTIVVEMKNSQVGSDPENEDDSQPAKLSLTRVSLANNPVVTGNEDFDNRFSIVSEPQEFVKMLLSSPDMADQLRQIKTGTSIEINDNIVAYGQSGRLLDADHTLFLFDLLCRMADKVESMGPLPAASD